MKFKIQIVTVMLAVWAAAVSAADANLPAIIPLPQKVQLLEGSFKLTPETRISVDSGSRSTGNFLAEQLRKSTGYKIKVSKPVLGHAKSGSIVMAINPALTNLGPEGYELTVATNGVAINASTEAGLFYGAQTLLQLLPPEIMSSHPVSSVEWQAPCVQIEDWPRFKWRGMMLDVSRHFFTHDEVKTFLDTMALHKLNTFHWHLVDDQGWRIEIKKYPRLTRVGAWRPNVGFGLDPKSTTAYGLDGRYGGFYSQDEIRDIVAYAASRHIMVVPEIEMPGHSTAALAAYPQYSCTGGPFKIQDRGGVFPGIYCPGNDDVYKFIDDVMSEVVQLFPGKYIHIGGDEVPKDTWKHCDKCQARIKAEGLKNEEELQSYFVRRVEKIVNAHGRSLIGWSEILQGGLAQNASVMDWIGGSIEAATAGHDVVMTPTKYCYFDHYQSTNHATEPRAIGGFLPLNTVYSFEPIPAPLAPQYHSHILGGQANLWTEYIPSFSHVEYMILPRMCALAEVDWSAKDARDWDGFQQRLQTHTRRLDALGLNYRRLSVDAPPASASK